MADVSGGVRRTIAKPSSSALWSLAIVAAWSTVSCTPQASPIDRIKAHGELRVVTLNSPTTFYQGAQGPEGFEYRLASRFAQDLGVRLLMYPAPNMRAMQAEIASGRADIAAAQLTADSGWTRVGDVSAPYEQIPQLVVYRQGKTRPLDTKQLKSARVAVRAGSPQERILESQLKTVARALRWLVTTPSAADPLEDVATGRADYAIVDAREFSFARHIYPDIAVGFTLPESRPAQWIVRHRAPRLLQKVNRFLAAEAKSGALLALAGESSGDTRLFEYEESRVFHDHVVERLPRYQPLFMEAATQTGIDWRLLAAIGYQESKWNPGAQSDDGALGVMMLTPSTAEAMGITNRNDPRQNISAGAHYFADVRTKIPNRIREPDRTWLTLQRTTWDSDISKMRASSRRRAVWIPIPGKTCVRSCRFWHKSDGYTQAKRGYARGWEPVQFVDRVQRFLTLLEWQPGQGPTTAAMPAAQAPAPTNTSH